MSLNLYDVNKSLLSASMLLVAASCLHAQNWQSKTIHDGKVSYFRYAEGASLNVRDCNFTKTKSGDIKLLGKCSFIIREPGKEPETITIKENEEYILVVSKPREKSEIRIEGVELSARKKQFSEIEIKQEALQNLQSFSLGDVLQQLPGQYVQKFDNTQFKNIVFRTASGSSITGTSGIPAGDEFGNKAFGVQLMVNDVVLSNNENMQSYNSANSSPFALSFNASTRGGNLTPAQANYGVDLREIPTENIESVEVIQGIPDAKYGDLTSGLIKVTTTAKASPLRLDASLREGTYQLGLTKGFRLDKDNALTTSFDYMNSLSDPRTSLVGYDRISANALWAHNKRQFRNKLSFSFSQNTSKGKRDPDDLDGVIIDVDNKSFSLSNNIRYNFSRTNRRSWFRSISADIGLSYASQFTARRYWLNQGARPYGTATENSVYYAPYTPPSYENQAYADGKPFNVYANISTEGNYVSKSKWSHAYSLGINYRYGDNFGKGRYGTAGKNETMLSVGDSRSGMRDYNYRDNVLATTQYALYIQDNITKMFANKHILRANIGLRYDIQNSASTFSPRVNTSYQMGKFTIRGGVGLTSKAPSLNQLYTGPRYFDMLLGDYRLPGYYSAAIMQTVVTPGDNSELSPSRSWKTEAGVDYRFSFATINLTGYYNKLFDGFTTMAVPKVMDKAKVNVSVTGTEIPVFEIIGTEKFHYLQNRIVNGYESTDKGLELMASFKRIEPLNLVVGFNATYVETTSVKDPSILTVDKPQIIDKNFQYGLYNDTKAKNTMARASFSFDYHLASSGMIIGLRTDHFLVDKKFTNENDIYPVGYIDYNLNQVMISEANRKDQLYQNLFRKRITEKLSGLGSKTLHNVHLRVTKDFLSGFRLSVYVSNVFNLKPYNEDGYVYTNFTPISFGSNISYRF
ncbi:TonB-dependent receptor plug domain-containing protein [Elizabethkingia anophelis]|uniref:TonB-dependent receptor plug domain-containing protein n=1 Tax=Elizabethkingia anophelis TaxID=1117645 RepID=UPI0023E991D0|nr:TonB-dependent receptor [Elizabethkingia anophelis]CAH1136337.1 Vitamin B12 transporter BtuB [Elizabethkingia anophelis]CAI9670108.1 Vitamin B12 transporter BtuB [Elizabethkingia anophelis]CAI9675388.1 Vitamin B12 transporter BtuB [Elizabethkingia anophelis]CAI9684674.1 Vitamin B12 transporter BtuB [Elizabethkingia anophelis]GJN59839.1 TonB-dependent receptor [Elizabethkingia anophelis]